MATLKQSTAYTRMFFMVSSTDHVSGVTGLSSPDSITLVRSKAGASFSAVSGVIAEVANGWYKVSLTSGDTDTLGDLAFHGTAAGADPVDWVDQVTAQILGDTLTANATQINSVSASSVTTINANIGTTQPVNFTGTGASALAKSDVVDIAGAAVSTSTAQLGVNVVNFGGSAGTFASGRPEVNTTHIAGSAVSTSSAQIGVNVVNAGGTAWASGSLTSGVFASGAITAAAIAADAIGASELAADAASEIAAAVWDLDATGHQTQGTFGQVLGDSGADTDSVWSLTNTNLDATVSSRLASSSYTSPPSAATISSTVWDEVLTAATHNVATSAGRRLRQIASLTTVDSSVNDASATTTSFVTNLTSAVDNFYNDQLLIFTSGTQSGQASPVLDYVGSTKTVTLAEPLTAAPGDGDTFTIQATHIHPIAQIAGAVWDEDATGHQTQGTFGQAIGDPGSDSDTIWGLANTNLDATVSSRLASASISLSGGAVTVGTNNDKTGYALTAAYDLAKTATQAGDAMTLTSAYDYAKGTVAMTESYAANGAAPTPIQATYAIHQMLMDFSISGTTYTVKQLDNSTTAFSVTLDSSTTPTSAHR